MAREVHARHSRARDSHHPVPHEHAAGEQEDELEPILLSVSDNGAQMSSGSTREFMAMCAIAQHFGRPGTPTDQAWIESLFSHVKADWPHLDRIKDPEVLRAELARRSWKRSRSGGASGCRMRFAITTNAATMTKFLLILKMKI